MKASTHDKAQGKTHQSKGKVKEVTRKDTDSPNLEAKGTSEKTEGHVQKKSGKDKVVGNKRTAH